MPDTHTNEALAGEQRYRAVSFWTDTFPGSLRPRPALQGDRDADVAIVGAGFTGLWTAYYLSQDRPDLRIVLLDAEIAGFGASGRNGGWCSAIFPMTWERIANTAGPAKVTDLQHAMNDTVDEIGRTTTAEDLDCEFHKGGYLALARNTAQLARAKAEIAEARRWGFGDDQLTFLGSGEASDLAAATHALGATFTPHCAVLNPTKLTRGLATLVENRGVTLYEQTPVTEIRPGQVRTPLGTVSASHIVRATEAYTGSLKGEHRRIAPIYSLAVATEPLAAATWDEIGLNSRPAVNDLRHIRIWGQRTATGHMVFGGRGAPYHFGSAVRPEFDHHTRIHHDLEKTLLELLPQMRGIRFTHHWGGPVAIPRDWHPSVGFDHNTGLGWGGPYVGDGVATSNLAGRLLRDLILQRDTPLTQLPITAHRSPSWEPEPLRWLGINAGLHVMNSADRSEARHGRPSRRAKLFTKLIGGH